MTDVAAILERFRPYLLVLARLHFDSRLRGKLDPADLVQQALLQAHLALDGLRQRDDATLAAWLRRILARTMTDAVRHYDADKRALDRERPLEDDLDRSASGLAAWLAAEQSTPSQRAVMNEDVLRLGQALTELPDNQREVVVLKHLQGWTLQQIADHTGRSMPAVVGLLRRGLENLRSRLSG